MDKPIRPLNETVIPPELDGSSGVHRCTPDQQKLDLPNDRAALEQFLAQYAASAGTHRIYSRECERLALWALHVRGKPISSLEVSDIEAFIIFLSNPIPSSIWCGPKSPRTSERWRPFVGGLDISARLTALSAINSMYGYWVDAGYISGNPLGLFRQLKRKIVSGTLNCDAQSDSGPGADTGTKRPTHKTSTTQLNHIMVQQDIKVDRYLDEDMWAAVVKVVEERGAQASMDVDKKAVDEYERLRFLMAMLYLLAPRIGELETHRMNSFREERGRWWWYVVGKGAKLGKVAVNDDMLQALVRYRRHLGLPAIPDHKDQTPLLVSTRHKGRPISARRLNQILKEVFDQAANRLPQHAEHKAQKLRKASAHWGRHTGITAKIDAGVSHLHVQQEARHADFSTTQLYIHDADEARHDDAQKQRLRWGPAASS